MAGHFVAAMISEPIPVDCFSVLLVFSVYQISCLTLLLYFSNVPRVANALSCASLLLGGIQFASAQLRLLELMDCGYLLSFTETNRENEEIYGVSTTTWGGVWGFKFRA